MTAAVERQWDRHRVLVMALVVAAVALRLAFVLRLPDLPLYWDEVHYDHWAKGFMTAWQALGEPATFAAQFAAALRPSLQKGELYSALVGLVYAAGGPNPRTVLIIQALLDGVTCVLVYGLATALGGRRTGVVALALATVYEPFIFSAARLQTECVATLLTLGALWLFIQQRRAGAGTFGAGMLLALAMLTRPALQFLSLVFLPFIALVHGGAPRRRQLALLAAFGGGFFTVAGPQLLVSKAVLGIPVLSGTLDPSINVYAGLVGANLGWRTDHNSFADEPGGELKQVLRERGGGQPADADYRRAALRILWRHPLDSTGVVCHKLYQAWSHPYNDSRYRFLTGFRGQRFGHRLLLVLAGLGIPLALRRRRVGLLLVATSAYLWGVYLSVHIEVRYAVIAISLALCTAALAVVALAEGGAALWRSGRARRIWIPALAACGMAVVLWLVPLGRLLEVWPTLTPMAAHTLRLFGAVAVMSLGAVALAETLGGGGRRRAWAAVLPALVVAVLLLLVGRPLAMNWREWHGRLRAQEVSRQQFAVPPDSPLPLGGELRLDLRAEGHGPFDVVVRVNGTEVRRYAGGLSQDSAVRPERAYFEVFGGQEHLRPWHSWYAVPFPVASFWPAGRLDVEVAVENHGVTSAGVSLYGDYPADDPSVYDGPSPLSPNEPADTSIEKYLGDGDFRMRRRVVLNGETTSSRGDGRTWSVTDLSAAPGRQFGRYRILLLLRYPTPP